MKTNEVFKRPTIKRVLFQITYPSLFFLENKIGDFQLSIMEKFPKSALLFRKQFIFVDGDSNANVSDIVNKNQSEQEPTSKIWQFDSNDNNYQVNVTNNSLTIDSQLHKTYKNKESGYCFRDIIEFITSQFFNITNIPTLLRVGVRYINECPMPEETEEFEKCYNTTFPVSRFSIEDAIEMEFKTVIKRHEYSLRHIESMRKIENTNKLILDFDSFIANVKASECLTTTDELHSLISKEFSNTIKEPIYQYMRGEIEL